MYSFGGGMVLGYFGKLGLGGEVIVFFYLDEGYVSVVFCVW